MDVLKSEMGRNISAYFLVLVGMSAVLVGSHWHFDKMIDLGASLVTAALVAFQAKRTPDGNTSVTSVTVPEPNIAPAPTAPVVK